MNSIGKNGGCRIGIFGGTFNPPHVAHLIVTEYVRKQLNLDKIFFVPSYISPHKKRGEDQLAGDRLRMVRLAVGGNPYFDFSDYELKKKDISYTHLTVAAFHSRFPRCQLFLIIGADNYAEFHTWKNPEQILKLSSLVVMTRPGHRLRVNGKIPVSKVKLITVPEIGISSSLIRKMVGRKKSIDYLVPQAVASHIRRRKLYR
ncbi:MAG TPA: nicotinate-nucleotide adenylyltransferase [Bacteroidota bacterium]|nr:nicotinate-nucleotide adenylyltransferase [Bacteroidota bacterium]